MRYKIYLNQSNSLLIAKTSGAMNADDFIAMAEDLLQHPCCVKDGNVLFDHTDLDFSSVDVCELNKIRR